MRRFLCFSAIVFLSMFVFVACNDADDVGDTLYRLQARMKKDDGIKDALDSLRFGDLNEEQKAHFCLVSLMRHMYRSDYGKDADSLVENIRAFYLKGKDSYMKAQALLLMYDHDRVANDNLTDEDNTKLLLEALRTIDKTKKVDRRLVEYSRLENADDALVIEQLKQTIMYFVGRTYIDMGLYQDMNDVLKESTAFFEEHGGDMLAPNQVLLALSYFMINEDDSCKHYSLKALGESRKNNDSQLIYNSLYTYGLGFRRSDKHRTIEVFKEANEVSEANGLAHNLNEPIGQLYFELKEYDSALFYTNKALENNTGSDYKKRNIYRTLARLYRTTGDYEKSADFAIRCLSIFYRDTSKEDITNVFETYRKELEHEKRVYEKRSRAAIIVVAAASLIVISLTITVLYQAKIRRKEEEKVRAMEAVNAQKRNVKENWLAKNKIYQKAAAIENGGYKDKPIVISDADWKELVHITDIVYDGFSLRLKELYPNLTDNDIETCCCRRHGFSDSTTAKLCGVELKSFQKRCQRIRNKINDGRDLKQIIED